MNSNPKVPKDVQLRKQQRDVDDNIIRQLIGDMMPLWKALIAAAEPSDTATQTSDSVPAAEHGGFPPM